jgi:hypothetical protein
LPLLAVIGLELLVYRALSLEHAGLVAVIAQPNTNIIAYLQWFLLSGLRGNMRSGKGKKSPAFCEKDRNPALI